MKPKYIIIVNETGMEVPIVFSPLISHEDMVSKKLVKSAGFCELDNQGRWSAHGWSDTLNLRSRPQDADILNTHLFAPL